MPERPTADPYLFGDSISAGDQMGGLWAWLGRGHRGFRRLHLRRRYL